VANIPSHQHLAYRFGTNMVHTVVAGGRLL
jgi:hypothetical protein